MKTVGIIGAAGYVGGELLRLLLFHPLVSVKFIHSNSQAGQLVAEIHDDLAGETNWVFTDVIDWEVDILFLCLAHGQSALFVERHASQLSDQTLLIDLSQDFRLHSDFVYGLPELHKDAIRQSRRIANPGCFATAIQLALLPLAHAGLLNGEIHVNATTGSTGAGQALQDTTHFSWRQSNLSVYKPFQHQHLNEISQSLGVLQPGFSAPIRFIPMRGAFTRGILACAYTQTSATGKELQAYFEQYYKNAIFTKISTRNPHLKQVVNTNKCLLYIEKHEDIVLIVSVIDNLIKGAAGQAIQNMNLAMGWEETLGLQLKAQAF